jgi:deoxyribodipyrimidine photo-lyase
MKRHIRTLRVLPLKKYPVSLFIFRRDLRLHDNTALNESLKASGQVVPCFIFDPRQIEPHPYQSAPGLQFMLRSLQDLQRQFRALGAELNVWHGSPNEVVGQAVSQLKINAVFMNRDYTPFSRRRDEDILQQCRRLGIDFHLLPDALLNEPEQVLKADQTPCQVFTPFYHHARSRPVDLPQPLLAANFARSAGGLDCYHFEALIRDESQPVLRGGREEARSLLEKLGALASYQEIRDIPSVPGTSRLSPHLKFGTCSVREVFLAIQDCLGPGHPLLRQLYWRDFFTHIGYHFPRVFGHAFREKYDAVVWEHDRALFQAWTEGRTGFPIVDAGMRELNVTGFMHNRLRMITASFLVKDLHVDWRWGERYFARHLVDYDPCVNNGNWQWAASTGCDAQPYFRIFNPWLQQQKFDPDCRYIYRWIPDLRAFPAKQIHQWDKNYCRCDYVNPIVNHRLESERAKRIFKGL